MLYEMWVPWILSMNRYQCMQLILLLSSILGVWPLVSFICINLWHFMSPTLFSYAKLPGFFPITMHWSIAQQTTQDTTLSMQLRHEENLHPCPVLSNRYDPWMACHDSHDPYRSLYNGLRVVQVVEQWWPAYHLVRQQFNLYSTIRMTRTSLETMVHEPCNWWTA